MKHATGQSRKHGLRATGGGVRPAGFTLVELLVTLVVLSTGIVVVLEAYQTAMVALAETRDVLRAGVLSQRLLAEHELAWRGTGDPDRDLEAEWRDRYPDFRWSMASAMIETGEATDTVQGRELVVTVTHARTGRELTAATRMLVREPEPPES